MSPSKITNSIIKAFKNLSIEPFKDVSDKSIYSYNYKHEMIDELQKVFDLIKSHDISNLTVKDSKCNYCYPKSRAYSFHHPETGEFIFRYVIFKESDNFYRIEECKNIQVPVREDGLPF